MVAAPKIRLFVADDLAPDVAVAPRDDQVHYLRRVMRLGDGDMVALFNGRDGEWRARLLCHGPRDCALRPIERLRAQGAVPDLWLGFAPVKRPHIDLIVTKATELGVARLVPVLTRFTVVDRVNARRLRANAIEAAEQCGRLDVPALEEPTDFAVFLASMPGRRLFWADESGEGRTWRDMPDAEMAGPTALLVGPEGGFSDEERAKLCGFSAARAVSLGPRILRAETAAIALITLWQASAGDWSPGE